jgi:GT2 family glycosyltransferase
VSIEIFIYKKEVSEIMNTLLVVNDMPESQCDNTNMQSDKSVKESNPKRFDLEMIEGWSMLDLSICIVSYNTNDLLRQCLESIYRTIKGISFEIFVVDNASTDGTVDMIKNNFPDVQLIANKKNIGFAAANNQAINDSKGRYTLLLNPDTVVLNTTLDKLVEFMDSHPEAGVVGPQILNSDRTFQFSYDEGMSLEFFFRVLIFNRFISLFTFLIPIKKIKNYFTNSRDMESPTKIKEVGRVRGCCLLVRHEVIDQIGLMDEQFFMYAEEVDWEYRMKSAGWKIYFYPFAQIIHYWGASTTQNKQVFDLIYWQSSYKYIRKHYGNYAVLLVRFMAFINAIFRTINLVWKRISNRIDRRKFQCQVILSWKIVWLNPNKSLGEKVC